MIKIANAPCSWGVLEFDLDGKAAGFEQVLDEIRETGYQGSELGDWGFMPTVPAELKRELDQRDLSMVGAFVPVFLKDRSKHVAGAEAAVKTAKLMADAGYRDAFIVLADDNGSVKKRTQNAGRVTANMGLTDEEWQIFAEGANYVAAEVKAKTGLRTVFHHHCAGYVETPSEIDQLLALTDPSLVGLVLDMGHYQFGGGNPLDALKNIKCESGTFILKIVILKLLQNQELKVGIISSLLVMVYSANSAKGQSISLRSWKNLQNSIMPVGLLLSRMFFPEWGIPKCAPVETVNS